MTRIAVLFGVMAALSAGACDKKKADDGAKVADRAEPKVADKAQYKTPEPPPAPPKPAKVELTADQKTWVEGMLKEFGPEVCRDGSLFRTCVDLDQAGCLKEINADLQACFDEDPGAMPKSMTLDEGKRAGGEYGRCAGGKYEAHLRAAGKFHNTPECSGS